MSHPNWTIKCILTTRELARCLAHKLSCSLARNLARKLACNHPCKLTRDLEGSLGSL